jgi:hypothetical protein
MRPHAVPRTAGILAVAVLFSSAAAAQTISLVEIKDLHPMEHRVEGFALASPQFLQVDATGAEPRGKDDNGWWGREEERDVWPAAAWIIDAQTRAVVWDLRTVRTVRTRPGLRTFSGPIRLPAGLYEAHFASFVANSVDNGSNGLVSLGRKGKHIGDAWYRGPYVDDDSYEKFEFRVSGAGRPVRDRELKLAVREYDSTAIATLRPDEAGATSRVAFELGRPADVDVYAVGEMRREESFDFGWIQTADTRNIIWRMDYQNSEDGGGASKNRMARTTLHLPAGRYVAYWASDDSHGPDKWNAVPPFDPAFWGMTLRIEDQAARNAARPFSWEPVPEGQTIASMVRMGNEETRSQGFTLRQGMDVRIYALGECTDKKRADMDDGAWLVDAVSRQRVWEMRCNATEPAGGAYKNRLFDGTVHLEAGSYMVYYKSDGSHSYGKWNAAPPAESRYWGVSLFPASGKLDPKVVGPLERDTVGIIADLTRIRDSRRSRRFFFLEEPTVVRIHAVGEGTGGEMDDYGWIEEEKSGDRVWEMTYKATVEAGGARKNRMFDGTVRLPAGRYIVIYQTDGSHAYGDWNADPPDDPDSWGIVLRRGEGK